MIQVQLLRGTAAQNAAFTGPVGLLVATTDTFSLYLHDGTTVGGHLIGGTATFPITPSQGGTGDTTLTAHSVLLGEGTSNVAFATIGTANRILADNGAGVDPSFKTISALLDAAFGSTRGGTLFRGSSLWQFLAAGTDGYFLQTHSTTGDPTWTAAVAGNDTVATGVAAAGTNQAGATSLTNQQNYVTGASGVNGVKVAAALMGVGAHVFVTNENTSNNLLVYPDTGNSINSLAANAPINVGPDTTAHFIMKSSSVLRSVP